MPLLAINPKRYLSTWKILTNLNEQCAQTTHAAGAKPLAPHLPQRIVNQRMWSQPAAVLAASSISGLLGTGLSHFCGHPLTDPATLGYSSLALLASSVSIKLLDSCQNFRETYQRFKTNFFIKG